MTEERRSSDAFPVHAKSKSKSKDDEPVLVEMTKTLLVAYFKHSAEILRLTGVKRGYKTSASSLRTTLDAASDEEMDQLAARLNQLCETMSYFRILAPLEDS